MIDHYFEKRKAMSSSSDDVVGLPCKQASAGCCGVMERKKASQGKYEGKEFLACNDRGWHESNPELKGDWILCTNKPAIDLFLRRHQKGPVVQETVAAPPTKKRAYEGDAPADSSQRVLLIDIHKRLANLEEIQTKMLALFEKSNACGDIVPSTQNDE
jgi:hypothetical protein